MKDAGAIVLVFGIALAFGTNFKGGLRVGNISGVAGPVMIIVGAIMMFS